jgi:hypothetical protein
VQPVIDLTASERKERPYRVVATFDDCHALRAALGELGVRLGAPRGLAVHPDEHSIEVPVAEPDDALAARDVIERHHPRTFEVLDFAGRRIS